MKTLREIVLLVSILGCGSVIAYVGVQWPYEPLRVVGDRYLDKRGATYSREEYLLYLAWSSFMWKIVFLGIGVNAALLGIEALTRVRSKSASRDKITSGDRTGGDI